MDQLQNRGMVGSPEAISLRIVIGAEKEHAQLPAIGIYNQDYFIGAISIK